MVCQLRASKYLWPDMMQKLQQLPIPLRVLAYVAAALVFLALAAGVGVMAALTLVRMEVRREVRGPIRPVPGG